MKLFFLFFYLIFLPFIEIEAKDYFYKSKIKKDDYNYVLSKNDEKIYKEIKENIKYKNWFNAYELEEKIENIGFRKAINIIISLNKFKNIDSLNSSEAIDLVKFNMDNYFLSEFGYFNTKIEKAYKENILKFNDVKKYFERFRIKDIDVVVKFYKDYLLENNYSNVVKQKIINYFIKKDMSFYEQEIFRNNFSDIINDKILIKRTEYMIFEKKTSYLNKNIDLINDKNYKIMFDNINKIINKTNQIQNIIKSTPKELRKDNVFLFSLVKYYRSINNDKEILDIIDNLENKKEYEDYWWLYKQIYIRNALKGKDYDYAYKIASEYNGHKNIKYVEAQWLAGWISLRYLKNYNNAYKHFMNINNIVSYSLSVSRVTYWLGRTAMAIGNEDEALNWYDKSSKYSTTFYGQLAHYAKYNILTQKGEEYKDFTLPQKPPITNEDIKNIDENGIVKLAFLYYNYEGKRDEAYNIFKNLILYFLKNDGEIAELIESINLLKDDKIMTSLSEFASYKSVFYIDNLYPILRMVNKNDPSIALIHSIIKKESGFIVNAESNVGAVGFMQIMPETAKLLCKEINITYNKYKLQHDPQYNIKLGTYYINSLIKKFKGSKILAIASYNAGPGATMKWIKYFGDPRESSSMEEVIDWIESITYKETREYLQRVLENLIVYEYKLGI